MHHANLLVGSKEWALSCIEEGNKQEGPDVSLLNYERMTIADVRTLIYDAQLRPITKDYRTFIIFSHSILHEAQNALLKLFEEPNEHTLFYLVIPYEDILLPTLRSRLFFMGREDSKGTSDIFQKFKKLGYAERLSYIASKIKEEDSKWVEEIIEGYRNDASISKNPEYIRDVLLLDTYSKSAGSSKKMLLEHVALSL
jgi:DNA polymerase III delta prime subunit